MRTATTEPSHGAATTVKPDHSLLAGRQAGDAAASPSGRPGYDGPMLFSEMTDLDLNPPMPDLLRLGGAAGSLLYRGESNLIYGAPDSGKSHLVAMLVAQEARAGNGVLWLDFEKNPRTATVRLLEHGLEPCTLGKAAYWHPEHADEQVVYAALGFANRHRIGTVVVDSVGRALARAEVAENDNAGVERWYDSVVEPILRAGLTVVLIDHTGHDRNGRPLGRPVGASAKLRQVTGTALYLKVARPYARGRAGHAVLVCAKDNNGQMLEGARVAELHVTPGPEGTVFELRPADQDGEGASTLADEILVFVRAYQTQHGCGPSKSEIAGKVGRGEAARKRALGELVGGRLVAIDTAGVAHRVIALPQLPDRGLGVAGS